MLSNNALDRHEIILYIFCEVWFTDQETLLDHNWYLWHKYSLPTTRRLMRLIRGYIWYWWDIISNRNWYTIDWYLDIYYWAILVSSLRHQTFAILLSVIGDGLKNPDLFYESDLFLKPCLFKIVLELVHAGFLLQVDFSWFFGSVRILAKNFR